MDVKVKYKYLDYNCKSRIKTIKHNAPDFNIDLYHLLYKSGKSVDEMTAEITELNNYLHNIDRSQMMIDNNMEQIISWSIVFPNKKNKKKIKPPCITTLTESDIRSMFTDKTISDQSIIDILAVVKVNKEIFIGLPHERQLKILLALFTTSFTYNLNSMKKLNSYLLAGLNTFHASSFLPQIEDNSL